MSNINLNCDVCGREIRGYTWVNGMRFCAKCYQETFGSQITYVYGGNLEEHINVIRKKDQRIAELNQELSDYRKIVDDLHNQLSEKCDHCKVTNQDTITLLETLKKNFEDIFDKALKHCSVNERYYDQVIDEVDKFIELFKGAEK